MTSQSPSLVTEATTWPPVVTWQGGRDEALALGPAGGLEPTVGQGRQGRAAPSLDRSCRAALARRERTRRRTGAQAKRRTILASQRRRLSLTNEIYGIARGYFYKTRSVGGQF
jgi:hypothetical protein